MDIGYGFSWPAFLRAIIILVVTGEFFHLLDVFSAFSVGSIHQKKC
ncbi:putative membrane protein [Escherichia coli 3-475-03_S3_C2]|nr:putative membrane protein [Escherichia coli 3-475-03_S3_C2]